MIVFPRIYSSLSEFEQDELYRLDSLRTAVEDMLEERFSKELDLYEEPGPVDGVVSDRVIADSVE